MTGTRVRLSPCPVLGPSGTAAVVFATTAAGPGRGSTEGVVTASRKAAPGRNRGRGQALFPWPIESNTPNPESATRPPKATSWLTAPTKASSAATAASRPPSRRSNSTMSSACSKVLPPSEMTVAAHSEDEARLQILLLVATETPRTRRCQRGASAFSSEGRPARGGGRRIMLAATKGLRWCPN